MAFWAEKYASPRFGFPITDWHKAFAWRPVRTFDGRWVWLPPVMRRRYHLHDYLDQSAGSDQWSIYATVNQ